MRIDRQAVWSVGLRGQLHGRPGLSAVGGVVKDAVAGRADASVFTAPGDDHVQRSVGGASQSPGEWFILHNAVVLQRPRNAVVRALVDPATEGGDPEHSLTHRTRWIEQDVGWSRFGHPLV